MFVGATTYASLTDSFLQGYRRYSHVALPTGAVDRYYNEVHRIAEALSARDVSTSKQDVADYFKQIQPKLAFIDRSQELLHLLSQAKLPVPAAGLLRDLFLLAGTALFPGWTGHMLRHSQWQQRQTKAATHALWSIAPVFRTALKDGIANRSCKRMGMPATDLGTGQSRCGSLPDDRVQAEGWVNFSSKAFSTAASTRLRPARLAA